MADDKLRSGVVKFLKTDLGIRKINFALPSAGSVFRLWPDAYKGVGEAISTEQIRLVQKQLPAGVGAQYDPGLDTLRLRVGFDINNKRDQAFLVHECTHAFFDIKNLGQHLKSSDEAAAYLAEAILLEAGSQPPLGTEQVRQVSHPIAKTVIKGQYWISDADFKALSAAWARSEGADPKTMFNSNGLNTLSRSARPLIELTK